MGEYNFRYFFRQKLYFGQHFSPKNIQKKKPENDR